jgi:molybdate transport system substrate-binding protein
MAASAVALAALIGVLIFYQPASPHPQAGSGEVAKTTPPTLLVYCAAGLQPPVSKIVLDYEASHHVKVETTYRGSGSLLSEIVIGGGDLFLAADRLYLDKASQQKLTQEIQGIAYQFPVIVTQKGNPKDIAGLSDLLKPDVRLSLADPDRAAIGKVVSGLLEKDERWQPLWKKAVIHRETVNEVGNDVKLDAADAGIVWNVTCAQYPDLKVVHVPEFDHARGEIAVGLLSASKDPQAAQELLDYIMDPQHGLKVFAEYGYDVITRQPPAAH